MTYTTHLWHTAQVSPASQLTGLAPSAVTMRTRLWQTKPSFCHLFTETSSPMWIWQQSKRSLLRQQLQREQNQHPRLEHQNRRRHSQRLPAVAQSLLASWTGKLPALPRDLNLFEFVLNLPLKRSRDHVCGRGQALPTWCVTPPDVLLLSDVLYCTEVRARVDSRHSGVGRSFD